MNKKQTEILKQTASVITKWIGSALSVVIHTLLFIVCFLLPYYNIVSFEKMLLVLTTMVSLEAIYLSIFIQMSINLNSQTIGDLQEDIEEISDNIEEIQEEIYDDDDDDENKELIEELYNLSRKVGTQSPKARQIIQTRINELKIKK